MAVTIDNPELEARISELAKDQPTRPSKTRLIEAILERATSETPVRFTEWLHRGNGRGKPRKKAPAAS